VQSSRCTATIEGSVEPHLRPTRSIIQARRCRRLTVDAGPAAWPGQLHGLALRHYLHRAFEPGHLDQLVAACISQGRRRPGGTQRLVLRARAMELGKRQQQASPLPPPSPFPSLSRGELPGREG
jgi:hypothetical protein